MVTEVSLVKLRSGATHKFIWDKQLRGFGVCCYPSGRKTFVVRYVANRKRTFTTIDETNVLSIEEARRRAAEILEAARCGVDVKQTAAMNIGMLISDYMLLYAKQRKKSWKKDESYLRRVRVAWGERRAVGSIARRDVSAVFVAMSRSSPYAANRMLEVVKKLFNLAIQWDVYHGKNPALGIPKNPERRRRRVMTQDEARRMFAALNEEDESLQTLFKLLLYTGARKSEVMGARWSDVNLTDGTLVFRDTKNGDDHVVPLIPEAVALIAGLRSRLTSPYLFPGPNKSRPVVNIDKAWKRVCERAELVGVRIHDIRRTTGSWLSWNGVDIAAIKEILNHRSIRTTMTYVHQNLETKRAALLQFPAAELLGAGEGEERESV